MKTISDYTICCTPQQTKKALELGAPIEEDYRYNKDIMFGEECVRVERQLAPPTSEQMIGWLEEQDIYINILWDDSLYAASVFHVDKGRIGVNKIFTSRKEAALAAIDASLDYLGKGGKE